MGVRPFVCDSHEWSICGHCCAEFGALFCCDRGYVALGGIFIELGLCSVMIAKTSVWGLVSFCFDIMRFAGESGVILYADNPNSYFIQFGTSIANL